MTGPTISLLEDNLAPLFGKGMAPFVIRRTLRKLDKDEAELTTSDIDEILARVERESLDRIYGASAVLLVAEIKKNLAQGTVIQKDTVRRLQKQQNLMSRVQELL